MRLRIHDEEGIHKLRNGESIELCDLFIMYSYVYKINKNYLRTNLSPKRIASLSFENSKSLFNTDCSFDD